MRRLAARPTTASLRKISSRQNPIVDRYRQLAEGREPGAPHVLLEGVRLLNEAREATIPIFGAAFSTRALESAATSQLAAALGKTGAEVVSVSEAVLRAMSPARAPSGVVAIAGRPLTPLERAFERPPQLVVSACDIQDPGNLGAIIRSAEAAGATAVIACGSSADPFGWKALRGSMGSALRLPVVERVPIEAAIRAAKVRRLTVLAATPRGGRSLFELDLSAPLMFIVGGEGPGLPDSVTAAADATVSIPMQSPIESLNVAVAAALLAFEAFRQRSRRASTGAPGSRAS